MNRYTHYEKTDFCICTERMVEKSFRIMVILRSQMHCYLDCESKTWKK